ncbi:hypothetical protein, partial [Escherichia coli]|uniref:hypothetical protein n=1 Tax=Escherichia coli TaxID=562 RepID=UPI002024FCF5
PPPLPPPPLFRAHQQAVSAPVGGGGANAGPVWVRAGGIRLVTQVQKAELSKQGIEVKNNLCERFAVAGQELFHLIRVECIKTFEELLAKHGKGYGCEVC